MNGRVRQRDRLVERGDLDLAHGFVAAEHILDLDRARGRCVELGEAERTANAGWVDAVLRRQHRRHEHDGSDDERENDAQR